MLSMRKRNQENLFVQFLFYQLMLPFHSQASTEAGRSGWITTSSSIRKAALDVRNHLEFQLLDYFVLWGGILKFMTTYCGGVQ